MLSIILVTYNQENYILETLNSMLESNISDVELVITDDCSEDQTTTVAEKWLSQNAHRFASVDILKNKNNVGVVQNVHRGFLASHGSLIKPIAGDDWFLPGAINLIKKYDGINNTIFCSPVRIYHEQTKKTVDQNYNKNSDFFQKNSKEQYKEILKGCFISAPGAFYSRDVWKDAEIYKTRLKHIEDWLLWIRCTEMKKEFRLIDDFLVVYRISEFNISKNKMNYKKPLTATRLECINDARYILKTIYSNKENSFSTRYYAFINYLRDGILLSFPNNPLLAFWLIKLILLASPRDIFRKLGLIKNKIFSK